jgi:hypothetical protein
MKSCLFNLKKKYMLGKNKLSIQQKMTKIGTFENRTNSYLIFHYVLSSYKKYWMKS